MPVDPAALRRSVHDLMVGIRATGSGNPRPVAEGLQALVGAAEDILGVDCVGVLLLDEHDELRSVASSNQLAAELERAQQDLDVGPGVDTLRNSSTTSVADLAEVSDYTVLAERVVADGARAVLSAPIWVNGNVAGNLNAIRRQRYSWSDEDIAAVEAYADLVATMLQFNASKMRIGDTAQTSDGHRQDGTVDP